MLAREAAAALVLVLVFVVGLVLVLSCCWVLAPAAVVALVAVLPKLVLVLALVGVIGDASGLMRALILSKVLKLRLGLIVSRSLRWSSTTETPWAARNGESSISASVRVNEASCIGIALMSLGFTDPEPRSSKLPGPQRWPV